VQGHTHTGKRSLGGGGGGVGSGARCKGDLGGGGGNRITGKHVLFFLFFFGDMVAAFINENDMYMYIHICKDTYIINILFYSWYFICTYHGYSICTYTSEFYQHLYH